MPHSKSFILEHRTTQYTKSLDLLFDKVQKGESVVSISQYVHKRAKKLNEVRRKF